MGPIHFSETLPVLVLLAAAGLLRLISGLRDYGVPTSIPTTAIVAYVLGGLSLFSVIHAFGLRNQATNPNASKTQPLARALAMRVNV